MSRRKVFDSPSLGRMDIEAQVGQRIREFRKQAGLSQDELGRVAKLTKNYLGEVERGSKGIGLSTLEKIAKALGVAPKDLLDFETEPPRPVSAEDPLARSVVLLAQGAPKRERDRFVELAETFFRPFRGRRGGRRSALR